MAQKFKLVKNIRGYFYKFIANTLKFDENLTSEEQDKKDLANIDQIQGILNRSEMHSEIRKELQAYINHKKQYNLACKRETEYMKLVENNQTNSQINKEYEDADKRDIAAGVFSWKWKYYRYILPRELLAGKFALE